MHIQPGEKQIPILMYHSIAWSSNTRFKPFAIPIDMFIEHMKYIHEHQYTPITVTDLMHARANGNIKLPERPIVLTFDDGFADFYISALPVLKQYGFVATLFVATAYVDGTSRWMRYVRETTRPMLTWKQLAEITANRIECGAHSHSHPQLDTLSITAARDEIACSKKFLERPTRARSFQFCLPFRLLH